MQVGDRFGRWVYNGSLIRGNHKSGEFVCDCGTVRRVLLQSVLRGASKSCGCLNTERITKHGGSSTPEYNTWIHIKHRCENPKDESYKDYGARGIQMYPDWSASFVEFLAYVGPKPSPELSLDRINTLKNYEPGNVQWATATVQANNRRNSLRFEHEGKQMTVQELADLAEVSYHTMYDRLHRYNFSVADAVGKAHYERPETRGSGRALLYGSEGPA